MWDVIIVGAGPAGLSAALILGRCRRRVLICDSGQPRNQASRGLHGFLTRDGIAPSELLRIGREQLAAYPSVVLHEELVADAEYLAPGFRVQLASGQRQYCAKLLLATGLVDELPVIDGLADLYGRSVFHCPYCDGWEVRDQPLGILGGDREAVQMALELLIWSTDLMLLSNGQQLSSELTAELEKHRIGWRTERVQALRGTSAGQLQQVVFVDGTELSRTALFFSTGQHQRSHLPGKFGCRMTLEGEAPTDRREATHIAGLFVTGDASTKMRLAIGAAAKGAEAAFQINEELLREQLR